ncbi:MAG: sigma-54-dependent Fis family transcriptional regulator [Myxococcales bacterium]
MKLRILVIDDEKSFGEMVGTILRKEGYAVDLATTGEQALAALGRDPYDLVLCDVQMPEMGGLDLLRALDRLHLRPTTIMMSAYGSNETALECMKLGAYDYIAKPFKGDELLLTLRKAEERERLRRENAALKASQSRSASFDTIVARSEPMMRLFRVIQKIAAYKSTVLITGESGTGKELVAHAIHNHSPRAKGPFVPVNCGAIPENLLESELFGYVKGAFTDAWQNKRGLFEEANGGTLFLDEIGELPLALQVKLLRVLQEEEIRRVGDTRSTRIDVRVVAATVRDLAAEVKRGAFREDLYYRLNVLPIHVVPLRDRPEDIPLLVDHFIKQTAARLGVGVDRVLPDALKCLMEYGWPGNVRELENTIERAIVLAEGDAVTVDVLPEKVVESRDRIKLTLLSGELSIKRTTRVIEEELIRKALVKTGGNRTAASKHLEISHRALLYKMKDYGIS